MPEIKNYDKKKHHPKKHPHHKHKRRPHHEASEDHHQQLQMTENVTEPETEPAAEAVVEADAVNTEALNEGVHMTTSTEEEKTTASTEPMAEPQAESTSEHQKIHLNFYGSELIRQKAPKVMDLADTVAEEWVHDGKFEGLPLSNPLAQMAAAKALRTAKDVEKKLEEKGVFAMAKMGMEYVKSKIEKKNK